MLRKLVLVFVLAGLLGVGLSACANCNPCNQPNPCNTPNPCNQPNPCNPCG